MYALIIEKSIWSALLIEDTLREIGYTSFDYAMSGDEAIMSAEDRWPDLITADVGLRTDTGFDRLHAHCARRSIPVVFLTDQIWEVWEGVARPSILRKPFTPADLRHAVQTAAVQPIAA